MQHWVEYYISSFNFFMLFIPTIFKDIWTDHPDLTYMLRGNDAEVENDSEKVKSL